MEHSLTLHNGEQLNFGFYGDVCRGKEEPLVPELNGEAESNKRFFEELIQERVLNLKYGGQSRRNRCGDLIFVRDGNEYWYPIRDGLSTIDNETFARLRGQLLRWATDNAEALSKAKPEMPPGLYNRTRMNWRALLAIAERCGWKGAASKAVQAIEEVHAAGDPELGVLLLSAFRDAFDRYTADPTADDEGGRDGPQDHFEGRRSHGRSAGDARLSQGSIE